MPLNPSQRTVLRETLQLLINDMLDTPNVDFKIKQEWLNSVISDEHPTLNDTIEVLRSQPALVGALSEAINIPVEIRGDWHLVANQIRSGQPNIPLDSINRLKGFPNYDPILIASMHRFETNITSLPEELRTQLVRLRELYLEMTPMSGYSYNPERAPTFYYRIGKVPLNLENFGASANVSILSGEIQTDVRAYIQERLEIAEAHQEQIEALKRELSQQQSGPAYLESKEREEKNAAEWTIIDKLLQKGEQLLDHCRYKSALACYEIALRHYPKNIQAHYGKLNALWSLEQWEAVLRSSEIILILKVDDITALYYKGRALRELEQKEQSLSSFELALKPVPQSFEDFLSRAGALLALGRNEVALEDIERAIAINPKAEAYACRGMILCELKRYELAVDAFDLTLQLNPKHAFYWLQRGGMLALCREYTLAIESFDQTLRLKAMLGPREEERAYCRKAKALGILGQHSQALACCEAALKINPKNTDALLRKGTALHHLGKHELAQETVELALKNQSSFEAHYWKGEILMRLNNYQQALISYDASLKFKPQNVRSLLGKSRALYYLGQRELALAFAKAVIEIQPDAEAYCLEGRILLEQGQYERSLRSYEASLQLYAGSSETHYRKGLTLNRLRRPDIALQSLDAALKLDPGHKKARLKRVAILRQLNQHELALEAYEIALELGFNSYSVHYGKARALQDLGYYKLALSSFDDAIKIDSKEAWAHYRKGEVLQKLERHKLALEAYGIALNLNQNKVIDAHYVFEIFFQKGQILLVLKRHQEALASFEEVLKLNPKHAGSHFGKGEALFLLNQYQLAQVSYQETLNQDPDHMLALLGKCEAALKINPNDRTVLYRKADVLLALKRYKPALEVIEKIAKIEPENKAINFGKAEALRALKKPKAALECYEEVLKLNPQHHLAARGKGLCLIALGRSIFEEAVKLQPIDASTLSEKGDALKDTGQYALALEAYEEALQLAPQDEEVLLKKLEVTTQLNKRYDSLMLYQRAKLLYKFGKYQEIIDFYEPLIYDDSSSKLEKEKALIFYEAAIKLSKDNADTHLRKGYLLMHMKKYAPALVSFNFALKLSQKSSEAHLGKGQALLFLSLYEKAIVSLEAALKINPKLWNAWHAHLFKGNALRKLNRCETALISFEAALKLKPEKIQVLIQIHFEKGDTLYSLGRYEAALASYEEALRLDPNSREALCRKGEALTSLVRDESALTCFEEALRLDPRSPDAHLRKGVALCNLFQDELALASFEVALKLDSQKAYIHEVKGNTLYNLNRYDLALASFEEALKLNSRMTDSYLGKARTLRALEQYELAQNAIDAALELNPNDKITLFEKYEILSCINPKAIWIYLKKGDLAIEMGFYEHALEAYEKGLALNPTHARLQGRKGVALFGLKRYNVAIACFKNAIELGDPEPWMPLGYCYESGGGVEKNEGTAIKCYLKAVHNGNGTAKNNLKNLLSTLPLEKLSSISEELIIEGNEQLRRDQLSEAFVSFQNAAMIDPQNQAAFDGQKEVIAMRKNSNRATPPLDEAFEEASERMSMPLAEQRNNVGENEEIKERAEEEVNQIASNLSELRRQSIACLQLQSSGENVHEKLQAVHSPLSQLQQQIQNLSIEEVDKLTQLLRCDVPLLQNVIQERTLSTEASKDILRIRADKQLADYYGTFFLQLTGVFHACLSIQTGMVRNATITLPGLTGIGLDKVSHHFPGASLILEPLKGMFQYMDYVERKKPVNKLISFFPEGTQTQTIECIVEGLARYLTFYYKEDIRKRAEAMPGFLNQMLERLKETKRNLTYTPLDNNIKAFAEEHCKKIIEAIVEKGLAARATPEENIKLLFEVITEADFSLLNPAAVAAVSPISSPIVTPKVASPQNGTVTSMVGASTQQANPPPSPSNGETVRMINELRRELHTQRVQYLQLLSQLPKPSSTIDATDDQVYKEVSSPNNKGDLVPILLQEYRELRVKYDQLVQVIGPMADRDFDIPLSPTRNQPIDERTRQLLFSATAAPPHNSSNFPESREFSPKKEEEAKSDVLETPNGGAKRNLEEKSAEPALLGSLASKPVVSQRRSRQGESLSNNTDGNYYWYYHSDAMTLLTVIRERLAHSEAHHYPVGQQDSAYRENNERCFIGDVYSNFSEQLQADVDFLLEGDHQYAAWGNKPRRFVLLTLGFTAHFRVVVIDINYDNNELDVLWDDPFGPHFPAYLKAEYLQAIRTHIPRLMSRVSPADVVINQHEKVCDQQGVDKNSWDCGPIAIQNVRDYASELGLALTIIDFARDDTHYAIKQAGTPGHSKVISDIRQQDKNLFAKIQGAIIVSACDAKEDFEEKLAEKWKTVKREAVGRELQEQVGRLSSRQLGLLFTILENKRLLSLNPHKGAAYSESEIQAAYDDIRASSNKVSIDASEAGVSESSEPAIYHNRELSRDFHFMGYSSASMSLSVESSAHSQHNRSLSVSESEEVEMTAPVSLSDTVSLRIQ